jgi:hypothetical protein
VTILAFTPLVGGASVLAGLLGALTGLGGGVVAPVAARLSLDSSYPSATGPRS